MNISDSRKMADILDGAGYEEIRISENQGIRAIRELEQCDIIVVNTCTVRANAENKGLWFAKSLKHHKEKNPNLKIIFCGCIVEDKKNEITKLLPHVDLFIPPNSSEKLEEFLVFSPSIEKRGGNRAERGGGEFVTIMHGCNNFCSYCIVPYVRGREKSRTPEEILEEIRILGNQGIREITLLGQNVNSYKYGFAKLLHMIEKTIEGEIRGLERIRFLTSHPKDMSDDIIDAVADLPHLCEHIHLPIQHGDDEILKAMNRGYTVDDYKRIAEKIRNKIKGVAITTDMIIGFPGETEKHFSNSVGRIREFAFDQVVTTIYSPRSKTAAAKMENQVPEEIKKERLQRIMKVTDAMALEQNKKLVGTTQEILNGRTRTNKIVKSNLKGQPGNVTITSARSYILYGGTTNDTRK